MRGQERLAEGGRRTQNRRDQRYNFAARRILLGEPSDYPGENVINPHLTTRQSKIRSSRGENRSRQSKGRRKDLSVGKTSELHIHETRQLANFVLRGGAAERANKSRPAVKPPARGKPRRGERSLRGHGKKERARGDQSPSWVKTGVGDALQARRKNACGGESLATGEIESGRQIFSKWTGRWERRLPKGGFKFYQRPSTENMPHSEGSCSSTDGKGKRGGKVKRQGGGRGGGSQD